MTRLFQYVNYIDYDELINKPIINHVVVEGDKSLADYGIQPAGNYAHLNENGKVPFEELDDSILGNLQYQGVWDAEHNNPNLPLVPSKKGQYWIVSHGGERFDLEFETGDWIIAGDEVWQKIDNTDTIISVNGKRGVVVLGATDIPYGNTTVGAALDGKQDTLTAGKNIKITNNVIEAEFTEAIVDYNLLYHHPSINGVELINNKTLEDLDVQKTIYAGNNVYLTKSDVNKMNDTVNVYDATESRKGVAEIATQTEVNTGTDDVRYVTPKKLKVVADTKVSKTNDASKIYGTDAQGNQTTYNESDVTNTVVDVTVDGTSVVTNKVANVVIPVKSVNSSTGDVVVEAIKNQNLSKGMTKIWEGSSSDYNDITTKDSNTVYVVEGGADVYQQIWDAIDSKQNRLIVGANITMNGDTISAIVPTESTITNWGFTKNVGTVTSVNNNLPDSNGNVTVSASVAWGGVTGTLSNQTDLQTALNGKQNTLTFDDTPTTSSNNPVKSGGIKSAIDVKQDKITGSNGEIVYHNGTTTFTQTLMNEGMACATAADVNICKNQSPSFSDVFNTWRKFSHLNGNDNAVPSEVSAWTYDSGEDTIIQPLNTTSYVGFISPKSYSSYDITVRCYSNGTDNDTIGLVAAFAVDANNKEHTLSFLRSPGGTAAKWVCLLDYCSFNLTSTYYGQTMIENKSSASTTPSTADNWNTSSIGTGTVINMTRSGNILSAVCSQFNSSTLDENTRITINLDTLSTTYPTLSLFKGSSPWGYSNFSQPNSKYENISVTDPDSYIFDLTNNQVLQYNTSSRTWVAVSGVTPSEAIGSGRLSYNKVTGKLFYCSGNNVYQIATNN